MNAALIIEAGGAIPCPSELWHDAALLSQDDACPWPDALDAAAVVAGYQHHDDATGAILTDWRASIVTAQPTTDAGRGAVRDALRLLHDTGDALVRMGWGAVDLFGVDPAGARHGLALRLRGGSVGVVERSAIEFRAGATMRSGTFTRLSVASGAMLFWELGQGVSA